LSPAQWIETTRATGIVSASGNNGGTFAQKDIAMEFASWISAEFKLYLIKEYQRLKDDENRRLSLGWNLNRTLAKVNYRIHTDAIKENLIPPTLSAAQINFTYADEADMLNLALFGVTAKQWKDANPNLKGNMRDYATIEQLLVLSNLESFNAELITAKVPQNRRIKVLNETAQRQLKSLLTNVSLKLLPHGESK
jgi:hypothetical protein